MNPIIGTGLEATISDLAANVAPYGVAAGTLVGAVVVIGIGLKWVKRFASKAS